MQVTPIKTRIIKSPQDDLFAVITESVDDFQEEDVLVVTSKVVSIHQGRCLPAANDEDISEKDRIVKQEAEKYIDRNVVPGGYAILTIKHNILIPSAGVDDSNGNGYYILWPKEPQVAAKEIYDFIKEKFQVKNFGVIITDSHTTPYRLGVVGVALAHYGFQALKNYIGEEDLFGRKFKMEKVNIVDSLATAAVLVMGEGKEQTPLVKISQVDFVEFALVGDPPEIDPDYDIYSPLLGSDLWQSGGSA